MTDEQVHIIQTVVEDCLSSAHERRFDIGNPAHLQLLVEHARTQVTDAPEEDLWLTVAMFWLGPSSDAIPSAALREELENLLRQLVPDAHERLERVMEFVIAYGCGKWRTVAPGFGGWEQRWQGALRGLVRALEPAVGQSNRWLAEYVTGFSRDRRVAYDINFTEDTAVWSDAWLLANQFVRPEAELRLEAEETLVITSTAEGAECMLTEQDYQQAIPPGAKAVWTVRAPQEGTVLQAEQQDVPAPAGATLLLIVRDEDTLIKTAAAKYSQQIQLKIGQEAMVHGPCTLGVWECACGTTHCQARHRLDAWNPVQTVQKTVVDAGARHKEETALTLWNFVASAIKGPQVRLQTGSFVQGMYFPLLSREGC